MVRNQLSKINANNFFEWREVYEKLSKNFQKRIGKLRYEEFGTEKSIGLPDFMVKNKKIMIEIKTGKEARLSSEQRKVFPKLIEKGWKIFLIKPVIRVSEEKIRLIRYKCADYLGRNMYNYLPMKKVIRKCKND